MSVKVGRILIVAVAAEVAAVLILVLAVAIFGPRDPEGAAQYAQSLGMWLGPIAGFVMCVIGGWFVSKNLAEKHVLNGFVLGAAVAAIDVTILVAGGAEFQMVFVVSNIGRVVAGTLGGWLASRS